MIISNRKILLVLPLILVLACSSRHNTFVNYSNPQIAYSGRIDSSALKGAELYWSGSAIKFNFEGTSISTLIEDEKGDNYFNVIIDNDRLSILKPDTSKRFYQLASGLSRGPHSIEIFKRTEWDRGKTSFYGFQLEGASKILPKTPAYKRKIEFYGNSVTAGLAIEDSSGKDSPDSKYINNYLSYGAITARHFQADYRCISKSGIGLTISWFPITMPDIYDKLNPADSLSRWDFSLYSPDIVVVNLLQNDSWLVELPDSEEYKSTFGSQKPDSTYLINAYQQFILDLRSHYPQANIICTLGCMVAAKEGSKWIEYINSAVKKLNDKSIYVHIMPYIEASAHPSIEDHEEMANSLIGFIEENIDW